MTCTTKSPDSTRVLYTECVLEAIDEVTDDKHAPAGHSFAFALPGKPHTLPCSRSLLLGSAPFTVSLWYSTLYDFDHEIVGRILYGSRSAYSVQIM